MNIIHEELATDNFSENECPSESQFYVNDRDLQGAKRDLDIGY